ncbi:MAG: hypothetical protein DMG79_12455 [Acidobacteria bacterium]|nr:MAG: hypothetical protein DMG79_12455 [Acidobacteriota bacterium]
MISPGLPGRAVTVRGNSKFAAVQRTNCRDSTDRRQLLLAPWLDWPGIGPYFYVAYRDLYLSEHESAQLEQLNVSWLGREAPPTPLFDLSLSF